MPLQIADDIKIRGKFTAFDIDKFGNRNCIYQEPNQIQYAGANILASALTNATLGSFPYFSNIKASGSTVPALLQSDSALTFEVSTAGFQATPSTNLNAQQSVICTGLFDNQSNGVFFYHFGLFLNADNTNNLFAYKHISGGLSWGVGSSLEIVWTIYLGTS